MRTRTRVTSELNGPARLHQKPQNDIHKMFTLSMDGADVSRLIARNDQEHGN